MGRKSRAKEARRVPGPVGAPSGPLPPGIQLPTAIHLIQQSGLAGKQPCDSLLDEMVEGQEYVSIIDKAPRKFDARNEIRRALRDIEAVRNVL